MNQRLLLAGALLCHGLALGAERPPNIVYILADDLGYGDLGCYGQAVLETPSLDRMAEQGVLFTRHYAGSTVCAPSRCVLMTGRSVGRARIQGNSPGQLAQGDATIATMLREAGYRTGCFGKWGVGTPLPDADPNRHGFEEFFGYVNMHHAHNFYPEFLVRNGERVALDNELYPEWKERQRPDRQGGGVAAQAREYAPALIFEAALDFIRQDDGRPFFLYYAPNLPHANNEAGREPRIGNNGMRIPGSEAYAQRGWPVQEQGFARMIEAMDQEVGRVVELLRELGMEERTALFFSSDNGPHQEGGHRMEFFDSNGPLRGMKRDLYEGGLRVPFLARWPGRFPAGVRSGLISGFQDMMPTLAELAGVPVPSGSDGVSLAPTLTGRPAGQQVHPHLAWIFHERGGAAAVLMGEWKAVRRDNSRRPPGPLELYHLLEDPREEADVSGERPALARRMEGILAREALRSRPEGRGRTGGAPPGRAPPR